jgi:hypothetical protein
MALAVRATAQHLWEARLDPVKITATEMATGRATEMETTKEMEMGTGTGTGMATGRATVNP